MTDRVGVAGGIVYSSSLIFLALYKKCQALLSSLYTTWTGKHITFDNALIVVSCVHVNISLVKISRSFIWERKQSLLFSFPIAKSKIFVIVWVIVKEIQFQQIWAQNVQPWDDFVSVSLSLYLSLCLSLSLQKQLDFSRSGPQNMQPCRDLPFPVSVLNGTAELGIQ